MTGSVFNLIFLVASISLFVFVLAFFIFEKVSYAERKTADRVEKLVGKGVGTDVILQKIRHSKKSNKKQKNGEYKEKKSIIAKIADTLQEQLLASDVAMKSEEFVIMWIVLTFFPAVIVALFLNNTFLALLLVVLGAISPMLFIRVKKAERTKKFEQQLADALLIASNSLRSGLSFQQAMETISHDMMAPISTEFGRAVREMNMGVNMEDALENIQKRVDSDEFKIAAVAVSVQRQTGGNLSDILMTISNTLKERFELKKEIKSITATGRMSGGVVAALPVGVGLILKAIQPAYLDPMFQTSLGKGMFAAAIILEVLGILVIKKIITIKY